jgi:hypothetical protein
MEQRLRAREMAMSDEHEEREEEPAEPVTEGDAAWRERTQDLTPRPAEIAPPPPRGIDPDDNRHP